MKILIGVTAPEQNLQQRQAVSYLAKHLNLKHTNMEQPVMNAVAVLLGVDDYELQLDVNPLKILPVIQTNLYTLKTRIRNALCASNDFYFMDVLHKKLTSAQHSKINNSFNGDIVSSMTTNDELAYIRHANGIVLHIINDNSAIKTTVLRNNADLMINVSNSDPLYQHTLEALAEVIAERFKSITA